MIAYKIEVADLTPIVCKVYRRLYCYTADVVDGFKIEVENVKIYKQYICTIKIMSDEDTCGVS